MQRAFFGLIGLTLPKTCRITVSMDRYRPIGGIGRQETLLAIIVIVVAAAILIPVGLRRGKSNQLLDESGKMRKVYIALSLYEEQYDTQPAPNLVAASAFDPIHADFVTPLDPYVENKAAQYPLDPGLDNSETSPFRISFSYIQNFIRNGKLHTKAWEITRRDPNIGVLANECYGNVNATGNYHANVSGRLLRINTDGSVYVLPDRGSPKQLGDSGDLFVKR